jgi:hypothetical protein
MAEAVIHRWVYLASNLAARLFDCAIVDFQQSICIAVKRSYPEAIANKTPAQMSKAERGS